MTPKRTYLVLILFKLCTFCAFFREPLENSAGAQTQKRGKEEPQHARREKNRSFACVANIHTDTLRIEFWVLFRETKFSPKLGSLKDRVLCVTKQHVC